ncbi:glycoside hydrolase family 3 protein [Parvularcula sp. LCG005]|uniref:glycoside hydrolase family 3 protein n=1 Tax=Parvularcula sp. LCG005 TaxID=3078805 RepID=UPI002943E8A3|nr:glycoside hydrolase family 3 N-terminal domain-containing protein [Parvularcula sp. LCG005]WOI53466.1 glycoside hydrolase family 3 N-terminal domain-containing protein [Parvularcula sp. LCG005]
MLNRHTASAAHQLRNGHRLGISAVLALAMVAGCSADEEKTSMPETSAQTQGKPEMTADAESTATAAVNNGEKAVDPAIWGTIKMPVAKDPAMEQRIDEIIAAMTLEQKVGQVIQADISAVTPEDVKKYYLGSVLNGGNSAPNGDLHGPAQDWIDLADAFWEASMAEDGPQIPIIWGTDAVHGHTNIPGATVFPHNIGLGATGDADLLERIGAATAMEIRVTGLDWTFAPTLAAARDDRWGRAYESYSEEPELIAKLGAALVHGIQGVPGTDNFLDSSKVVATSKHFLGDGGTDGGKDQGETISTEEELRDIHGAGYYSTLNAGVQSVMASFSSWGDQKMHGRKDLLTDVLKEQWDFDGLVVGDWNGHGQIKGCTATDCPDSINAGLDMYMAPDSWKGLYETTLAHAQSGEIPMARLDDAVRRILRVKMRANLFEQPKPSEREYTGKFEYLGGDEHTEIAREAVRKSAVLIKNNGNVLPLSPGANVLVAGDGADNLSKLSGGWTISWQGEGISKKDFPQAETLLDGIRRNVENAGGTLMVDRNGETSSTPDVAVVVFGEDPYAEFRGDIGTLDYKPGDDRDVELLRKLKADGVPVVAVFLSGRPLWMNPELNASDAFVAAWLPGTQAGALADVLFTDAAGEVQHDFTGRLSFSWPKRADQYRLNKGDENYDPLFPLGYGLTYGDESTLDELHEDAVATEANTLTLFDNGAVIGGWTLKVMDDQGAEEWSLGAVSSPSKALTVKPADLGQQENALRATWDGSAPAELIMTRTPTDFSRETNAQFALAIDYLVETPASGDVHLTFACGEDCGAPFNVSSMFSQSNYGGVQSVMLPLKCVADAGVDMTKIDTFALKTTGELEIVLAKIAVVPAVGGATCTNFPLVK